MIFYSLGDDDKRYSAHLIENDTSSTDNAYYLTYLLVQSFIPSVSWGQFSQPSPAQSLLEILPALPVTTVVVLCRRHRDLLPHFLLYFQQNTEIHLNPSSYVPFLASFTDFIPPQWIVSHVILIEDIKYCYTLCMAAITAAGILKPLGDRQAKRQEEVYSQYCTLAAIENRMSRKEALIKLSTYRAALRTISDAKLSVSLCVYMNTDKTFFVQKTLSGLSTPSKMVQTLRTTVIPFCQAAAITIETQVTQALIRKNWDVASKLSIIKAFVISKEEKKNILEATTYDGNCEMEMLMAFAADNSIPFTPNPQNLRHKPVLERSVSTCSFAPRQRNNGLKRSPSIELMSSSCSHISKEALANVADGKTLDPVLYASKLSQLKNHMEIRPLYTLADEYGIVVSYEDFTKKETKLEIASRVLHNRGLGEVEHLVRDVQIDGELIIKVFCTETFPDMRLDMISELLPFINKGNANDILAFVRRTVIQSGCTFCYKLLQEVYDALLDKVNREGLQIILRHAEFIEYLMTLPDEERDAKYRKFVTDEISNENLDYIEDDYHDVINGLSGNTALNLAKAIRAVRKMEPEEACQNLLTAIKYINGNRHTRLHICYSLLNEKGFDYAVEVHILELLIDSRLQLDFRRLVESPTDMLQRIANLENLTLCLEIAKDLDSECDSITLNVICKKMNSTKIEDYFVPISKLVSHDSGLLIFKELMKRLDYAELPRLLETLGHSELIEYIDTIRDVVSLSIPELVNIELLQNMPALFQKIYGLTAAQDHLGPRIHSFVDSIATRHNLDPLKVRLDIADSFLEQVYEENEEKEDGLIQSTAEEKMLAWDCRQCLNILFVLQPFTEEQILEWGIGKLEGTTDPRIRELIFQVLCTLVPIDMLPFDEEFSYNAFSEYFGYIYHMDSIPEKLMTINLYRVFNAIAQGINPGEGDIAALKDAAVKFPILIVKNSLHIIKFFGNQDEVVDSLLIAASFLISVLINRNKQQKLTAQKCNFMEDVLTTLAAIPVQFTYLYWKGEKIPIIRVIEMLVDTCNVLYAAKIASHVPDQGVRRETLSLIIKSQRFDEAFHLGYSENYVFNSIMEASLVTATETMIDEHFSRFTNWLHNNGFVEALVVVKQTLKRQGRIIEKKKIKEKLQKLRPNLAKVKATLTIHK